MSTQTAGRQRHARHDDEGTLALRAARRLEDADELDAVADRLRGTAERVLAGSPGLAEVLRGGPVGHALHPLLTDLPLGLWTSATVLDLVGGPAGRPAADRLVGLGVLAALPTAVTGVADWVLADTRTQRVGVVHAGLNGTVLVLYGVSWLARRRGRRAAGLATSLLAGVAATASGYLGGHMSFRLGSRVEVEPQDGAGDDTGR